MWEILNTGIIVVPSLVASFVASCYFGFWLLYGLIRSNRECYRNFPIIFFTIIIALVAIPFIMPFSFDSNLMIAFWSAYGGAIIPFAYFLLILILG